MSLDSMVRVLPPTPSKSGVHVSFLSPHTRGPPPAATLRQAMSRSDSLSSSSSDNSSPPSPRPLTLTQLEQRKVEAKVAEIFHVLDGVPPHTQSLMLELWRDKHVEFLMKGLTGLGPSYQVLDANRPWICYWLVHSLVLLGEDVDQELEDRVIDFLSRCQDKNGGYGGGPGQLPHLATTYAAVNCLITLGSEKALSSINRDKTHFFFLSMKDCSGGYRMHNGGEIDVRACYTALSVASCLNILDNELVDGVGNYILRCQTYEGGIAGEPGSEAHGGYTFCGVAAMILIGEADKLDLPGLMDWVVFRQGVEGGFQGRVNKLVDGCYSYWQGGVLALLQRMTPIVDSQLCHRKDGNKVAYAKCVSGIGQLNVSKGKSVLNEAAFDVLEKQSSETEGQISNTGFSFICKQIECSPLFDSIALQQYILLCSQVLEGGFKDKPGKYRDHYHSCYCLSGLSVCQYSWLKDAKGCPKPTAVLGPYSNLVEPIHPLYNVELEKYFQAHEFFSKS